MSISVNLIMIQKILIQLRQQHGLTQETLAKKLGVSRPTYIQIEKGERELTVSEAQKLAQYFELSLDDFLSGRKPVEPEVVFEQDTRKKVEPPLDIRISVPQERVDKFKEVLLYILSRVGAKPNVGETVLYKLLYFIDFDYYEKYEEQLIGAKYIKNHHGPTPVMFKKVVDQMVANGEVEAVKSKYFQYDQKKYLPLRAPDLRGLNAQELALIDEVLERLANKSAKELSEYSHQDVPWMVKKPGQAISYESVFYRSEAYSVRVYDDEL